MADGRSPLRGLIHNIRSVVSRHRVGEYSGLRIVKDPAAAEIDIVAVHGLGGEGFGTWITTDPKAGKTKSWLEELLGQDIPNARIMTYGYISQGINYGFLVHNVLYGRALDLVQELAARRKADGTNHRPLFFLAHSLGGWIVKRALVISSEAAVSELKDIELATCGAAFFGTLSPGSPSAPSPLADVIRRTTSGFDDFSKKAKPNKIQPSLSDLDWLENQMEAFKAITATLPKLSFYETKKSHGGYIVDKNDSVAGTDGEQFGLKATHSDLIKFCGREDSNYQLFINKFRDMVERARKSHLLESKRKVFDATAVRPFGYQRLGFSIPYILPAEPSTVIERRELLDDVETSLSPKSSPPGSQLSIVHLWGPAGSGKTTLAKQYAEIHKGELSFVFWIWAESSATVVASYLQFASALVTYYAQGSSRSRVENDLGLTGVDEMTKVKSIMELDTSRVNAVVRAVKDWLLRPENDKWLLIFDHIEPSYDIFEFIPLTLSGKIILTSRDSNCCSWGVKLEVGPMSEQQALDLLKSTASEDALDDPAQAVAGTKLVQHLGYNPESIVRAGSTIRKKRMAVSDYRDIPELKVPTMMPRSTIDQSPVTTTILRITAMLSTSIIPVALFSTAVSLSTVPAKFTDTFAELQSFQNPGHLDLVLQHLWDQNLIQTPSPTDSIPPSQSSGSSTMSFDYFFLDPSARKHVRSGLTSEEQIENAWLACNICVNSIRKKSVDSETLSEIHDFGRVMAPHATTCYDDWSAMLRQESQDENVAWQVLGNVCMAEGAVEQAIGCFELSLLLKVDMDPIERIQTNLSLAWLLQQQGEHKRSSDVLANIDMASLDKALGFRVAMARASMSIAEDELQRAESQYKSLEHEQEEVLGPTDMSTISTVQKLASTLEQLGKLEEAQALYRRVYISYQNMLGQSHPMTLNALEDLANICLATNSIEKAESLYTQSVRIKTETLGAQHPSTAQAIAKLAVIDDFCSRYDSARLNYTKALDIMSPTLGKVHPLYTTTAENLALSTRWHAHFLLSQTPRAKQSPLNPGRGTPGFSSTASVAKADDGTAAAAFNEAERLYLEVLSIKKAARELYSDEQVLDVGSKLREMYDNEVFFAGTRKEKIEALMTSLKRTDG